MWYFSQPKSQLVLNWLLKLMETTTKICILIFNSSINYRQSTERSPFGCFSLKILFPFIKHQGRRVFLIPLEPHLFCVLSIYFSKHQRPKNILFVFTASSELLLLQHSPSRCPCRTPARSRSAGWWSASRRSSCGRSWPRWSPRPASRWRTVSTVFLTTANRQQQTKM